MPAIEHPPQSTTAFPELSWSDYYPRSLNTYIHITFAFIPILLAIGCLKPRARWSPSRVSNLARGPPAQDIKQSRFRHSFENLYPRRHDLVVRSSGTGLQQGLRLSFPFIVGHQLSEKASRTTGQLSLGAIINRPGHFTQYPDMDGTGSKIGDGFQVGSPPEETRAVSSGDARHRDGLFESGASPVSSANRSRHSRSTHPPSRASSLERPLASDNEIDNQYLPEKEKGVVAEPGEGLGSRPIRPSIGEETSSVNQADGSERHETADSDSRASFPAMVPIPSRQFSRPPPPPPLTPPAAFFPFENRHHPSYATSPSAESDTGFIHQHDPEYSGSSPSADVPGSSSPQRATAFPHRRSYTKSVPIGVPAPSISSSDTTASSRTASTFSPSSYPPTSPMLPPPPPGHAEEGKATTALSGYGPLSGRPRADVGGVSPPQEQEIDLRGEIISVVDDAGYGWKRHTRVYGGGVCLACLAAEARNPGEGGFYGETVPLEERR